MAYFFFLVEYCQHHSTLMWSAVVIVWHCHFFYELGLGLGQVRYGGIRRSSASPRSPCDGTPSASVWPSPTQTPGLPCPHPSDRTPPDATMRRVDAPSAWSSASDLDNKELDGRDPQVVRDNRIKGTKSFGAQVPCIPRFTAITLRSRLLLITSSCVRLSWNYYTEFWLHNFQCLSLSSVLLIRYDR